MKLLQLIIYLLFWLGGFFIGYSVALGGDWNKKYDNTEAIYSNVNWIKLKPGEAGQFLTITNDDPVLKWVTPDPIDEITITELDYVNNICFDLMPNISGNTKRCVSVKWLYEFLGMMGR